MAVWWNARCQLGTGKVGQRGGQLWLKRQNSELKQRHDKVNSRYLTATLSNVQPVFIIISPIITRYCKNCGN